MADPNFWRDLAKAFRAIRDPFTTVKVDWSYTVGSGKPPEWSPTQGLPSAVTQFEALARRGGKAIATAETTNLLHAWLERLKKYAPGGSELAREMIGSKEGPLLQMGTVMDLCGASANLCSVLESQALETEHRITLKQISLAPPQAIAAKPTLRVTPKDRKGLRDSYFAQFPEKIKIRDVCWAAKQHYREWTRWLAGELKDTSTAARAFHAILTSGKRPEEYRKEVRPPKWK